MTPRGAKSWVYLAWWWLVAGPQGQGPLLVVPCCALVVLRPVRFKRCASGRRGALFFLRGSVVGRRACERRGAVARASASSVLCCVSALSACHSLYVIVMIMIHVHLTLCSVCMCTTLCTAVSGRGRSGLWGCLSVWVAGSATRYTCTAR